MHWFKTDPSSQYHETFLISTSGDWLSRRRMKVGITESTGVFRKVGGVRDVKPGVSETPVDEIALSGGRGFRAFGSHSNGIFRMARPKIPVLTSHVQAP